MIHAMVGHPGSLYFGEILNWRIALTCSVRKAFSRTFTLLFTVQRSFKNLAYEGVCLIASNKGMFILTCLNTSYISEFILFFFDWASFWGKGGLGSYVGLSSTSFSFLLCSPFPSFSFLSVGSLLSSLLTSSGSSSPAVGCIIVGFLGFSISFPFLRIVTDWTYSLLWLLRLLPYEIDLQGSDLAVKGTF